MSALAALAFTPRVLCGGQAATDGPDLHLEGRLIGDDPDLILEMILENRSTQTVRLQGADLPWKNKSRLLLVAVLEEDTSILVGQSWPISDSFDFEQYEIPPSRALSGRVNLAAHFPDLASTLEQHSVQLYWSYRAPTTSEGREPAPLIGGVLIGVRPGSAFARILRFFRLR